MQPLLTIQDVENVGNRHFYSSHFLVSFLTCLSAVTVRRNLAYISEKCSNLGFLKQQTVTMSLTDV
jgi:hypothetical protein